MLSRKESCAGVMAADRARVGERLQAALAGLQELHLLRERQAERVDWALGAHTEEPASVCGSGDKQDRAGAGPVCAWGETGSKGSLGTKEERSRSGSGEEERHQFSPREIARMPEEVFLSPGERHQFSPEEVQLMGAEEQRLEATLTALKQQLSRLRRQDVGLKSHLQILDQQINELKLDMNKVTSDQQETDSRPSSGFYDLSDGGSGSLSNSCTSLHSACMSPVTSADGSAHHRVKAPHLGSSWIRSDKPRPRPVSTGDLDRVFVQTQSVNEHVDVTKNLLFHYPSPLHAVALRSPARYDSSGDRPRPLVSESSSLRRLTSYDSKTESYIEKILQRSMGKLHFHSPHREEPPSRSVTLQVLPPSPGPAPSLSPVASPSTMSPQALNMVLRAESNDRRRVHSLQDTADHTKSHKHDSPHGRESSSDEQSTNTLQTSRHIQTESSSLSRSQSDSTEPRRERRNTKQQRSAAEKCVTCQSSSAEEAGLNSTLEAGLGFDSSPKFVHARFVPASSQRVKARQSKNSKPKKKIWAKDWSARTEKKKTHAKVHAKAPPTTPKPAQWRHASENSVSHQRQNYDVIDQRRRRHMDVHQAHVMYQLSPAPNSHLLRSSAPSSHMVRSVSARAGSWVTSQRPFPTSLSVNSFHQSCYPASPYHVTRPPRCESEYSAECASLFHSTIAPSSDGEVSDHTANRFGDSETTDSDSSWSQEGEEPPLCPAPGHAPSACRIKASRALKKKIRRFQPDALKVMTLV